MMITALSRTTTFKPALVLILILAVVPALPLSYGLRSAIALGLVYAIVAVGLDVFSGYAGQLSFGNFGFVAVGAYCAAIAGGRFSLSPWATIPISLGVTAAIALLLGVAMVRLPHLGSALVSFFFAFLVVVLLTGDLLSSWTQGENGIPVPTAEIGQWNLNEWVPFYYLAWTALLGVSLLTVRYANSRAGQVLRVVKRSEVVASTLGASVTIAKLSAFVYSAVVAGLAGFIYAQLLGYLAPASFSPNESIYIVAMMVVGGLGSIAGPILGALFFTILGEVSTSLGAARELLFAGVLLLALVLLPSGIYGGISDSVRKLMVRRERDHHRGDDAEMETWSSSARTAEDPTRTKVGVSARVMSPEQAEGVASRPHLSGRGGDAPVGKLPGWERPIRESGATPSSSDGDRPPLLRVDGLCVSFGGVSALDSVSFAVADGSVHALIGPNGAGKTTLLNCLTGLQSYQGDVLYRSASIRGASAQKIRRIGIGRTFQHPALAEDLSVRANTALGAFGSAVTLPIFDIIPSRQSRRREVDARRAATEALNLVGVSEDLHDRSAGDLSLAQQKIVDVARAIAGRPRLLLLDEPTAGLESDEMAQMADVLESVRGSGVTVLVISHHIGFLRQVAENATVLDFGSVLASGPFGEVTSRDDVVSSFLGGEAGA